MKRDNLDTTIEYKHDDEKLCVRNGDTTYPSATIEVSEMMGGVTASFHIKDASELDSIIRGLIFLRKNWDGTQRPERTQQNYFQKKTTR